MFAEDGTHVDRRRGHGDPQAVAAETPLDPVDRFARFLSEPIVDALRDALQPAGGGREVLTLFGDVDLPRFVPQRGHQLPQSLAERIGDDVRSADAAVAARLLVQPVGHALEETGRPVATLPHLFLGRRQLMMHQQAAIGAIVVQFSQRVLDLSVGDAEAQMVAGHGFHRMGFVKDDHVKLGQNADLFPPQGQVGEEQGMVDDQDLGVLHPPPSLVIKTLAVHGALRPMQLP